MAHALVDLLCWLGEGGRRVEERWGLLFGQEEGRSGPKEGRLVMAALGLHRFAQAIWVVQI